MAIEYQRPSRKPKIIQENGTFHLTGDWTRQNISHISFKSKNFSILEAGEVAIDGTDLASLDTAGALLLYSFLKGKHDQIQRHRLVGFNAEHEALLNLVFNQEDAIGHIPPVPSKEAFFAAVGKAVVGKCNQFLLYMNFFGQFIVMSFHSILHFTQLQIRTFLNSIHEMGYSALPIIALLSFLVGVVIAYQLGVQLQNYGANAFMVNLVGNAILREFGPLITAIIGAGRTSAALTAQLGAMKINEEIDALRTMGFSPFDILVVPRVIAALIAFPLLMIWADIFGILGGMIVTKAMYGTLYGDFLIRLKEAIDIPTLMVGLSKAPAFALIISLVGCFHGMNVSRNADSLGIQTTKSVVQSIFFIIIADSIYAIIYSKLNI